jgi:hypothetical protein
MTDDAENTVQKLQGARSNPFKKGYDPRRWLKGRPKKPSTQKAAEELIQHVIWDVLSEEITNPATNEKVDRLRAMIRSMTTNKQMQDKILDRILGKVVTPVDVTSNGESLVINIKKASDESRPDGE